MPSPLLKNSLAARAHWSFANLHRLLWPPGVASRPQPTLLRTRSQSVLAGSKAQLADHRAGTTTKDTRRISRSHNKPTSRPHIATRDRSVEENTRPSTSFSPESSHSPKTAKQEPIPQRGLLKNKVRDFLATPTPRPRPKNFWTSQETERIEGLSKLAVSKLYTQLAGSYRISCPAFNLKVCRMPFREPPSSDVPLFVQKAMQEYKEATLRYEQELQEREELELGLEQAQKEQERIGGVRIDHGQDYGLEMDHPDQRSSYHPRHQSPMLAPPEKPRLILQYDLSNKREHPDSVEAPHPPYRATFVISKKQVSKLAIHRNFVRKKMAAAVETTFRTHARPGYEYMFFVHRDCVTMPQQELVRMMVNVLSSPALYGDRRVSFDRYRSPGSSKDSDLTTGEHRDENGRSSSSSSSSGSERTQSPWRNPSRHPGPFIAVRWMNNQPPEFKKWWKHALPNPLGRVQQSDRYLDMYCPKDSGEPFVKETSALAKQTKKEEARPRSADGNRKRL